ncbi:hypothetical protein, partial [Aedoeadaptatus coxii]|uniref:hypothetical protein n=1 Tax=Aedoeadaptatus coxii TaxID=755172 RepID=UPI002AA29BD4
IKTRAGLGAWGGGYVGNAAFASEPFPSSPRQKFPGCMKPIQRQSFCENQNFIFCEELSSKKSSFISLHQKKNRA